MSWYAAWGKRALDVMASSVLLVVLSPVMLVVALSTWAAHGWPVLFVQERPGRNGRPFRMYKFRTMKDTRDEVGELLPDHLRTTSVGSFLRKFSLDELPELVNVLRGEMSLVGPRPLLMSYLPRYTPEQARRHEVRPGVTGLAQVRGRNAIDWETKFAYDVEYVDDVTLRNDLRILLQTVGKVFSTSDVNAGPTTTMPEFMGSATSEPDGGSGPQ